jgi:hypothetical protein
MQRKTLGSWKQSSGGEFFEFFLQDPVTFPNLFCEIRWQERSTWITVSQASISIDGNRHTMSLKTDPDASYLYLQIFNTVDAISAHTTDM